MGNYTQLSMIDRRRLHTFLEMGFSITEIADRLQKHRSTIYRELSRNQTEGHYLFGEAHCKAKSRARRNKICKLRTDAALYDYVVRHFDSKLLNLETGGKGGLFFELKELESTLPNQLSNDENKLIEKTIETILSIDFLNETSIGKLQSTVDEFKKTAKR